MILCIETATNVCSVALCDENRVVSLREQKDGKAHSSLLTVYIKEILDGQKICARDLQAVAVSKGPGSFTGLRIGVSVAKGIAYGTGIPLIGIDTLTSLFHGLLPIAREKNLINEHTLFCPMIEAKRMEVFYCIFNSAGERIKDICTETITDRTFINITGGETMVFFGDGADKCSHFFTHERQIYISNITASASFMHIPAMEALKERRFENTAYFEPFYLKDFITTKPKRKVI